MPEEKTPAVPSPVLVAAWERLGTLQADSVPLWAAHWLVQGFEGQAIAELAGLSGREVREVHDLLPQALSEAGVGDMSSLRAAAKVAFDHIARLHLEGLAGWQWVIGVVEQTIAEGAYAFEFFDEPLAATYGLDDELTGGWGRKPSELQTAVREACLEQVGDAG